MESEPKVSKQLKYYYRNREKLLEKNRLNMKKYYEKNKEKIIEKQRLAFKLLRIFEKQGGTV